MPRLTSRVRQIAAILALSLAVGGCVVAPARPYYGGGWVVAAPPVARVEYYGAAPYPGYFWMAGYWRWGGGGYAWAPGHWSAPRAGYRWMPRHWVQGRRGWRMAGGRWARR
jgi:hypothetical protein